MPGDRVSKQVLMRVVPHTSVDGEQWQRIGYGITSGAGAADGTTVVAASFTSGGADGYNGRYYVEILSGTCKGQMKRIVDDNGSGTYTIENNGFSAQIGASVIFSIWKSPEPVIVVDGALDANNFNDDYRDENDIDWVGYYVMPITGSCRGEIRQVSLFEKTGGASEGLFTVSPAFSTSLAAGDVCLLGRFFEVDVTALPGGPDYHPRPINRVNYSVGAGVTGARGVDFAFNVRPHGTGSLTASGSAVGHSDMHALFTAAGLDERLGTSSTVGAGSTTTAVAVATGSWENHQAGDIVMHNGNARRVTALTDGGAGVDTITVAPPLPVAPTSGDTLYALATYYKSADATTLYGCVIEVEIDGVRTTMTGCKGTLEPQATTPAEFAFSFKCDHWIREYEDAPYNPGTAYSSQGDILGKDMMAWADSTQIDIKGFAAQIGRETIAREVTGAYGINGRAGFHHINYACGASYREIMADGAELEAENRYLAGTDRALFVQCGASSDAFCIAIPVAHHVGAATPDPSSGLLEAPNVLAALDAGTYTDPDGTITKVPDWILGIS